MPRPTLKNLPAPPPGRLGWPWTQACSEMPATMPGGRRWPRITVVTPSFNQARFVEATIRSILLQGYPDLEYLVLDGGSTDGSVEIIRKYAPWLTDWASERDKGQSDAINRGLRLGSGVFAGWINSDDMLAQDALVTHATRVGFQGGTVYAGDCTYVDEHDGVLFVHRGRVHTLEDLLRVRTVWRGEPRRGHLVQPEVLFPREMALEVGGLDIHDHRTMDYELWGKLLMAGAAIRYTGLQFGVFRVHGEQKTGQGWATTRALVATAARLAAAAPGLAKDVREEIVADLYAYERDYWRSTGPLARLGLPDRWVMPLRELQSRLRRRAAQLVRPASAAGVSRL